MHPRWSWTALVMFGLPLLIAAQAGAAMPHDQMGGQMSGPAMGQPSIRITSRELHMSPGGVPRGWKFSLPDGDPKAGREAFVKFECFKCHAVKGEHFPAFSKTATDVGPALTGMGGGVHPPEYFAEAIMNPNAVILDEPGYTGPDGKSRMPNYVDSMSLRELVDVVAYIYSLKGEMPHGSPGHGHGAPSPAPSMPHGGPMKAPGGGHGR